MNYANPELAEALQPEPGKDLASLSPLPWLNMSNWDRELVRDRGAESAPVPGILLSVSAPCGAGSPTGG